MPGLGDTIYSATRKALEEVFGSGGGGGGGYDFGDLVPILAVPELPEVGNQLPANALPLVAMVEIDGVPVAQYDDDRNPAILYAAVGTTAAFAEAALGNGMQFDAYVCTVSDNGEYTSVEDADLMLSTGYGWEKFTVPAVPAGSGLVFHVHEDEPSD